MNRYFCLVAALCLYGGCKPESAENVLLPKEQMTTVLWDMIQVDELATLRLATDSGKNAKNERIQLYQKVFKLHKISEQQFSRSFKYYSGHPDLMKVLFDSLEARGTRERKNSYLPKDSIRK